MEPISTDQAAIALLRRTGGNRILSLEQRVAARQYFRCCTTYIASYMLHPLMRLSICNYTHDLRTSIKFIAKGSRATLLPNTFRIV